MCPRRANPDAHEALLDAAREEFARHGVDGARVEDIARRAGVSKGAFYLHFRTKEGVFEEILQRLLGVLADHAARREEAASLGSGGATGAAELAAFMAREQASDAELLEVLWRHRKIVAALESAAIGRAAPLVLDFRRGMRALIARKVEDGQRSGTLRPDLDPHALGDLILGAYEAFARRMVDLKEKPDLSGWGRVFVVAFYEGALTRAARGARPPVGPHT
jgi:AcrR family transcriptional regulator